MKIKKKDIESEKFFAINKNIDNNNNNTNINKIIQKTKHKFTFNQETKYKQQI